MNNTQLDTPAEPVNDPVIKPVTAPDWQAVIDILDNPFIKPCERDKALFEQGYRLIRV